MRFGVSVLGLLSSVACQVGSRPMTSPCLELPADEGEEVARVGEIAITVDQVVDRLNEQGSGAVRRYANRKKLREFVEDQIRFELLVRAALERGLARDPEVVQAARKVMVRRLLQRDLGPSVTGQVSEERIRAYYEHNKTTYQQPEKRRLAHIQLSPDEDGRARAQKLLDKLQRSGSDANVFRALVLRHSLDTESRSRGGEIPFRSREELTEEMGPSFADEVFRLPPGTLAPTVVQSTRGWHVVRVVSRREALVRSLDDVRDDIRERLLKGQRAKRFDKYLVEIKQRYPVALYEERLDEVLARMTGTSVRELP
jgi:parvulin-like peptidyl-prolyl isomerase